MGALRRALAGRGGSVLVHVLVTGILVSLMAAGLLSVLLLQHNMAYRHEESIRRKMEDGKALSALITYWTASGATCGNFNAWTCSGTCPVDPGSNWTCAGCVCGCTSTGNPTVCVFNGGPNSTQRIEIHSRTF